MGKFGSFDEYIDTREVESQISDLESRVECIKEDLESEAFDEDMKKDFRSDLDEVNEELDQLNRLKEDVGSREWYYGLQLIREDVFEDYARELASDLYGSEISNAVWPFTCIDWEQAANDLRMDYSEVDFDDASYLYRD